MSPKTSPDPDAHDLNTEIALFRYGLIAPLLHDPPAAGQQEQRLREIAAKTYRIPDSTRTQVSLTTLRRYLQAYRAGGFDALRPPPRADAGLPRAFPPAVLEKAIALREEQPARTTQTIVDILQRDESLPLERPLNVHTLTTHLRRRGKTRRLLARGATSSRRFERDQVNALWQGDGLVGPWLPDPRLPGKKRRTHLFCFLDDHSRLAPYAEFFFDEALPRMERVLKVAILRRGLPQAVYVDNGQVYSSTQFNAACASLGTLRERIQTAPYSPQAKGKQERFFETLRAQFLPEVEASNLTTLTELNESLWAWLECIYHQHEHSETGQTPLARYSAGLDQVRQADPETLRRAFLWREKRKSLVLEHKRRGDTFARMRGTPQPHSRKELPMTTIAKKLAQVKSGTLFAGLDLGLDSLTCVVLAAGGQRVDRFKAPQSRDGYEYLHRRWLRLVEQQGASGVLAGMEPTNYYWKQVGAYLNQQHVPFRLVNPYTVKRRREGDQLDRAKDDWRDGFMIADLLRTGKFNETRLRTGAYAELQIGHATYWRLRHDRGRQLTRLTNSLRQVFPEMPQVFKDLTGLTAQAVLCRDPAAAHIRAHSCSEFIAQVRQAARGQRLAVGKLRQLHTLASYSIGLADGLEGLCFDLQASLATLNLLDQQTKDLVALLVGHFRALPEAPYLCSIDGLGEMFALGILAETGALADYGSGKDLIKLAGTQPTPKMSGRSRRRQTPFSKQGRSRLRLVRYWATLRLVSRNAAIAYHYQRLQSRAQQPLTKMEAVGACMNKLLWYVWRTGHYREAYDPERWRTAH